MWTYNDEFGANEPDLGEIADTCSDMGCVPYCVPGPSETCIKYTEWTGKHMSYTSSVTETAAIISRDETLFVCQFCGKVNLGWDDSRSNLDRCFRAGSEEYCACDVFMRTQCNSAISNSNLLVMTVISFVFPVLL